MAERIGFIGLGVMGKPMVRNLAKAGFEVVVHSRTRASVDELVAESPSIIAADSPSAVAAQVKVVIICVPDSPDVLAVALGDNGLIESVGADHLVIDMSTIAPDAAVAVAKALSEKGAHVLDAPVSGGDKGAIAGTLSIMVGGDAADFDRAMPYFEAMGKTIVHVGGSGAGQVVKACNQIAVAVTIAAVSEALVLGAKLGVDPNKVVQVLSGGLAASRVLELRGPGIVAGNFAPGFRIDLHRKDLNAVLQGARAEGVVLPVTALVSQLFDAASANGRGDLDHSAFVTVIEELSNQRVCDAVK